MSSRDFIIALFCRVDNTLPNQTKHHRAKLCPYEIVALGMLCVLKGLSFRAFYRGLARNFAALFPNLPERTRLLRLLYTYAGLAESFLFPLKRKRQVGYLDIFGVAMLHPRREGRSPHQWAKKGRSNCRVHLLVNGMVGAKFCPLLDARGNLLDGNFDTANVHDSRFVHLAQRNPSFSVRAREIAFRCDSNFHKSQTRGEKKTGACSSRPSSRCGQARYT